MGRTRVFENESDNWLGVSDPRERKRIQDRLVQRARRRRLALASKNTTTEATLSSPETKEPSPPTFGDTGESSNSIVRHARDPRITCKNGLATRSQCIHQMSIDIVLVQKYFNRADLRPSSTPFFSSVLSPSTPDPAADVNGLTVLPVQVYAALWINGQPLGLKCKTGMKRIFSKAENRAEHVPESLWPTDAQLTIKHHSWIDRFPFPKFRNNLIRWQDVIDPDQFFEDLFSGRSFVLKPDAESWNPSAWRMQEDFASRWGFLFL